MTKPGLKNIFPKTVKDEMKNEILGEQNTSTMKENKVSFPCIFKQPWNEQNKSVSLLINT